MSGWVLLLIGLGSYALSRLILTGMITVTRGRGVQSTLSSFLIRRFVLLTLAPAVIIPIVAYHYYVEIPAKLKAKEQAERLAANRRWRIGNCWPESTRSPLTFRLS